MVQPNQIKDVSMKAVRRTGSALEQTFREIPDAAKTTARLLISAEERLQQRLRSFLRVALATMFLGISGLISLGANVTMAFAKKVSPETTRDKRTKHSKGRYQLRHAGELALRKPMHGTASWYGNDFDQQRTASGVTFDTHAMMAAHRSLPFGTKVRVTNLRNHKSCIVEITDRGPFSHHRIIDLSYAAAEKIGMTQTGTAKVQLEVLGAESSFQEIASATAGDAQNRKVLPVFDQIPSHPTRTLASLLNAGSVENAGR